MLFMLLILFVEPLPLLGLALQDYTQLCSMEHPFEALQIMGTASITRQPGSFNQVR